MTPITRYHAHVYFDPEGYDVAARLREEAGRCLPVEVGRLHPLPVGPHPKGMFQILLAARHLAEVLEWLMRHRGGLDILLHPDTGNDLEDHTSNALWLGAPQPLNLSFFR